jgi:benzoyl-CoA reductase subunit C
VLKTINEQNRLLPNKYVEEWKNQDKKVIGFLCSYVPEEVIHAAGMLPFRIRGTGCTRMSRSDAIMSSYSCSFARSCLEYAIDGTYDFLDGLIGIDSCSQISRLYDNWRYKAGLPFMHLLNLPYKNSDAAVQWYLDEIKALIHSFKKTFGVTITDQNLQNAIKVYNESRRLLGSLYDLRKSDKPPITGAETHNIILAGMSMPREQFNRMLSGYLKELEHKKSESEFRARLMLIGSSVDDPAFIKIIEDKGGLVVTDALCFGSRYFSSHVDEEGDPLLSLARSYLMRPQCPRMMDGHATLYDFIEEMVKKFNVDGIIFQKIQYCTLWGGSSFFLEKKFKASGIPFLSIEREHVVTNAAQIATRVEAFIEMIEGTVE